MDERLAHLVRGRRRRHLRDRPGRAPPISAGSWLEARMSTASGRPSTEPSPPTFCGRLWAAAAGAYSAILDHPFITGVVDGSLERASFHFYLLQDGHYLQGFARSLAHLAARAPNGAVTELFARHTADVITVERSLHSRLLAELATMPGGGAEDPGIAPTTLAYVTYLIASAPPRPSPTASRRSCPATGSTANWVTSSSHDPHPILCTCAGSTRTPVRNLTALSGRCSI
jgi:hypothetical protein